MIFCISLAKVLMLPLKFLVLFIWVFSFFLVSPSKVLPILFIFSNNQLFSSVQLLSHVWLFATPWIAARQASLFITISHFHRVRDAIQPSHPLSSPSPPAASPSQHQGLFQWVNSSHQVANVLEFQLQRQSFQWIFRVDFLCEWQIWSPCCPVDSQESSPAPQFKSINSSALSFLYSPTSHPYMTTRKTIALTRWTLLVK